MLYHKPGAKSSVPQPSSQDAQLSEMPCFQAFFGIYFCTFDINTTHSTCIGISSLYYMAKRFVQKISDFRQRVAFARFTPFSSISPLFRVLTIPILIGKTSVHFVSPLSISLIHLGTVGTFFPERSIFTISSVSSFLQNLSRI